MHEDHLFLGNGSYSGFTLNARLKADLQRLLDYQYVSSIGLQPSIRQRAWHWWRRWAGAKGYIGSFRRAESWRMWRTLMSLMGTIAVTAILQPFITAVFVTLLLYFGFGEVVKSVFGN